MSTSQTPAPALRRPSPRTSYLRQLAAIGGLLPARPGRLDRCGPARALLEPGVGPALLREGDADARAVLARLADRLPSPAAVVCRELITPRLGVACSTP